MLKCFNSVSLFMTLFIGVSGLAQIDCDKCSFDVLRTIQENHKKLTQTQVDSFICTLDDHCLDNAEFSQWSNELLFLILEHSPRPFIESLDNFTANYHLWIYSMIENPVGEQDLQKIYDNILTLDIKSNPSSIIVNSIEIAAQRSEFKLVIKK